MGSDPDVRCIPFHKYTPSNTSLHPYPPAPGVDRHQVGAESVMDMLFSATGIPTARTLCAPLHGVGFRGALRHSTLVPLPNCNGGGEGVRRAASPF